MDLTLSLAGEVLASGGKGEKKTEVRKNVVALMKKIGVYFPFGESDKQKVRTYFLITTSCDEQLN